MKLWNRNLRCFFSIGVIALIAAAQVFGYVARKSMVVGGQIVIDKWAPSSFPIAWRMNPTRGPNVTGDAAFENALRQAFRDIALKISSLRITG